MAPAKATSMTRKCPCRLGPPPIPPESALLLIPAAGEYGQIHTGGWSYFLDCQERELNNEDVGVELLSAVCTCGGGLYEIDHEFQDWQVAADILTQLDDK